MEDSSMIIILLFLTCSVHLSSADTHSLQFLYTAITPSINFPEFTAVGLVDGEQCVYYDSNIRKMIPKTEWMQMIFADDAHYWNIETKHVKDRQDQLQNTLAAVRKSWNPNEGVHTLQRMYGCELHDDSTENRSDQYGYDGEDFISLDLNTGSWTTANDKAELFIKQWDPTGDEAKYWKNYLKSNCIDNLKKFVSYGRETLERKVPPTASVLQKHSPSPEVVCHATGFFPKAVNISWRKDGEDVNEDVELRETLPNQDGSFQKRSILKVPAEELQKHTYTCVIQHSSLEEELVLNVNIDKPEKSNYAGSDAGSAGGSGGGLMAIIVGVVVALVVLVAVVAGIMVWKKKNSGLLSETLSSLTLEAEAGDNVTIWCQHDLTVTSSIFWFKHTSDSVPLLLGCKNFRTSSPSEPCYFFSESERIVMSVHGSKTSLTITAVNVSDTGLYYCSFTERMIFRNSTYLQVKGVKKTFSEDKATDSAVFFMLNVVVMLIVVFGAVIVFLLGVLIFIILKHRKTHKGLLIFLSLCVSAVPPTASVLQKHSPSPEVVCHATGFFPKAVNISWRKDGEDMNEEVELRETFPNQDGSFQKRSILKVPAEELQKHTYTCVIQHSSLEEELVLNVNTQPITKDTHILQYLYTAITPGINVTAVGLLDGEQCVSYDCKTKEMIPKIEWIQKISADEPHYWNIQTQIVKNHQEHLHNIMDTVMRNWNQNKGVHTLQRMFGCERHDDSTTRGYNQYGYDGEDFISLDLNTGSWTADNDKAVIFIKQWDPTGDEAQYWKDYLKNDCIEQLKKFVSYRRETLKKKVPPTASVLQKHSSSPEVVCHATGFFPKAVNITWRKDGEDVNEDVELRETLSNQDGSFQKRSVLKVPAEELQKHTYTCVIQHSSLEEELVLNVNKQQITKDGGSDGWKTGVGVVAVVIVVVVIVAVTSVFVWKKKKMSAPEKLHEDQQNGTELHSLTTPPSDAPV
ncbi:hypothetical protein QTP70_015046 [Hemibagrus guttatus]|uniref:Ig-like domain-containing protein n=1 Tax=Hemibagrus guttatus TaxID=175788 RepID=A0AAE0UR02_9TELE|nr:hypothetical protein QTP70_015046 [Hemibagrus guttatus]